MAVDPTLETKPNVVILEASQARRGFAISWIAQTLVTAVLIGICLHAEVVGYVARYASQQEISKLITIVSPVMAQQTPLPKDDEAVQLKQAVDSGDGGTAAVSAAGARQGGGARSELVKAWRYVGSCCRCAAARRTSSASGRQRDGGTGAVSAAGARQGRSAGNRTGEVRLAVEQKPAPDRSATDQLNRMNQLALSTNRAGATAASTSGPTIRHPEPTWAMTDDGIPAHKFGRRFGDKSS